MKLHLQSHAEQVATYLKEEIQRGRWNNQMPGEAKLERELGVNHTTIGQAFQMLENSGILIKQGAGKRRKIAPQKSEPKPNLKVGILYYEPADHHAYDFVDLKHQLFNLGYTVTIAPKSMMELGMNLQKIAPMIENTEADAWVVAGASGEILQWFEQQKIQAIAYAGGYTRQTTLACVAPDKSEALTQAMKKLISLGHRRIIYLTSSKIIPTSFKQELKNHGIPYGAYNAPDWKHSPEGLRHCLDTRFAITPPTAMIIDEAHLMIITQNHLAQRRIFAPGNISLVCTDPDKTFNWCKPTIAHINWHKEPVIHRIVKWVINTNRGKEDRKHTRTKAEFVDGGTIGPIPKK